MILADQFISSWFKNWSWQRPSLQQKATAQNIEPKVTPPRRLSPRFR